MVKVRNTGYVIVLPFHKPLRHLLATLMLFIILLVGSAGISNTVLCYGSDGHVELEALGGQGCSDFEEKTSLQTLLPEFSMMTDHCGGCIDIPLMTLQGLHEQNAWQIDNLALEKHLLAWVEPLHMTLGYISHLVENQMAQPPPVLRPPVHTFLNSIILLI